jgi:uncharacterized protein YjbI with pentapeptide repeats
MYKAPFHKNLTNQYFSGQDLRGKDFFNGADLRGANFSGADLRNVDFSGASIQGANFQNANLCEANFTLVSSGDDSHFKVDFSGAKIKGTIFTNAILRHADFTSTQAGLNRFWIYILIFFHLALALISAFTTTISFVFLLYFFFIPKREPSVPITISTGVISALVVVIWRTLLLNSSNPEITSYSVYTGMAVIFIAIIVGAVVATISEKKDYSSSLALSLLFVILMITKNTGIFAPIEQQFTGILNHGGAWLSMVTGSIIGASFGCWFSLSAITGNTRFNWLWKFYLQLATHGGTLFNGTDLTDAIFTSATLKGANFEGATITRTRWGRAKFLEHSRVGNSYLKYPEVRQLVTGRKLKDKIFDGLNLEGINLEAEHLLEPVDLSKASFIAANLKLSNLKGSILKEANLQQAKLDGANLSETCLTGACLQDWTIDEQTNLSNIQCEYIFLEELPDHMAGRRRFPPAPNTFKPGDFERRYRKDSSVLELIIRSEDDPQALTVAFQQLIYINRYQFQGFEMFGDDAFVKIKVPENVDKNLAEREFHNAYQTKLDEVSENRQQNPVPQEQQSLQEVLLKAFEGINMKREIKVEGDYFESFTNAGGYARHDIINISQDLPQAAAQIQDLLDQLKKDGVTEEVAQQKVAKDIATQAKKDQTAGETLSKLAASIATATVSDVIKGVVIHACKLAGFM